MKKFIVMMAVSAAVGSVFAMSKVPADAGCCSADKACQVKKAACCTADGSCKADAACKADKAACGAKAAVKEAGCPGGVCPLPK
jgi:hypothetical protein